MWRFRPFGDFEQLVLLALVRLGDQAYGVSIHDEIVRRAQRDVTIAAVYKTLERLEDKGLAASRLWRSRRRSAAAAARSSSVSSLRVDALWRQALASLRRMTDGLPRRTRSLPDMES